MAAPPPQGAGSCSTSYWYHEMVTRTHRTSARRGLQGGQKHGGRGISINRLVQEAIAEKAEKAVEERLSRAYDMLAEDSVGADIESFFAIQAEALLDE